MEDMIPIYLIVAASAGLFNTCCSSALIYQSGDDKQTLNPLSGLIQLFQFAWFIAGNVWIYSIYEPNYTDPSSPYFCNKTLYLFAFWVTNSYYILFGVVLGIVKCCTCCTCCACTCCMGLTVKACCQSLPESATWPSHLRCASSCVVHDTHLYVSDCNKKLMTA